MSPRGREARPAPAAWNVAKTLIQTACFWTFFLFVVPPLILAIEEACGLAAWRLSWPPSRVIGVILFLACGTLGVWSGVTMAIIGAGTPIPFDCPRRLVIRGPYRFVRNPMVIAGIGQGISIAIFYGSAAVLVYAISGAIVWNAIIRPWEERDLAARFGVEFEDYRRRIACWIPSRAASVTSPAGRSTGSPMPADRFPESPSR